jgi:hypothetical protein
MCCPRLQTSCARYNVDRDVINIFIRIYTTRCVWDYSQYKYIMPGPTVFFALLMPKWAIYTAEIHRMYHGVDFYSAWITLQWTRNHGLFIMLEVDVQLTQKEKLSVFSPRANYTDLATAACQRSQCQLSRTGMSCSQCDGSLRPYFRFCSPEQLLFFK